MQRLCRWVVRIGLGIAAFLVFIFAVLLILKPSETMILAGIVLSTLFFNRPPPIMDGVITAEDWNWVHQDVVKVKLTNVLQRDFPAGTSEAAVKAALLKQGFKPWGPFLKYEWGNGVCSSTITVKWTTGESSRITGISGNYQVGCL